MHIEEMTAEQIVEVLLGRDDGLSSIDSKVLADELIERDGGMDAFGTETLIEVLRERKNIDCIDTPSDYSDYCVAIEKGGMLHGSGKVGILVVKNL